ncbi:MAG TPA: hypothetical protein VIW01_06350 [Dehalococcoidia bacterium]
MRSLPLNLAAFVTAAVLVMAVSLVMVQAGLFGDADGGSAVSNPTLTPAVLEATASPTPSETLEGGSSGSGLSY